MLPNARKDFGNLPSRQKVQVDKHLLALQENPRPAGCRPLEGKHAGMFRVRVGDYRIIYQIQADRRVVIVVKVRHRKDASR